MEKDFNSIGSIDDILSEFHNMEMGEGRYTKPQTKAKPEREQEAFSSDFDAIINSYRSTENNNKSSEIFLETLDDFEPRKRTKPSRTPEFEFSYVEQENLDARHLPGKTQEDYFQDLMSESEKEPAIRRGRRSIERELDDVSLPAMKLQAPAKKQQPAMKSPPPAKKQMPVEKPNPASNKAPLKTKPHDIQPDDYEKPTAGGIIGSAFASLIFLALLVLTMAWSLFNIHPASSALSTASGSGAIQLSEKLDVYVNNAASDALGELAYIKKIYTLQENDTISPVPNPECFGTTNNPADILELINRAALLLEGQSVIFDATADFVPGEPIRYYLDDTILVIAWKEYINQRCCTCAEVKIAHGSQLRRKIAEDSYSSSVQLYASDMAKQANSVVAINGDFYAFRDLGITAYQRKLYRNNPDKVDSCFFTASGDMIFSRAGELKGPGEAQQFIDDNDVVFAIAFGPVLVDNGELQYCQSYPIGEMNTEYSRSCISIKEPLHYFLMTINHTPDARPRATINELARFVYSKGVYKSYNLDGGQTSEIVMNGGPINHVDFGNERAISDIIYFATALPNEEAAR